MPAEISIKAVGIKEALRELNTTDKRLRRQITADYKKIVQPITSEAQSLVPQEAPLSGFNRNWQPAGSSFAVLPFTGATMVRPPRLTYGLRQMQSREGRRQYANWLAWKSGIRAYVSGKRPTTVGNYTRNLAAFGVRWQGPAAVLFDTSAQARTPQGQRMVNALQSRFGPPSRVMWRAYDDAAREVQEELNDLVEKVMRAVGRDISVKP